MPDQNPDINQSTAAASQAQKISDSIMSPYCPGMTLSACPSSDARSLRVEIEGRFNKGYTEEAVINELKMRFGEKILPTPPNPLLNHLAFMAPWCFIAVALLLLARYVSTIRERAAEKKINN